MWNLFLPLLVLVVPLGIVLWRLRTSAFEAVVATLLGTPVIAFLVATLLGLDLSRWLYLVSLVSLAAGLTVLRAKRSGGGPSYSELLPIGVLLLLLGVNLTLAVSWPDFFSFGERMRDYAVLHEVLHHPLNPQEPWLPGYTINYYLYWYRFGHFLAALFGWETWQVYHALMAFTFALFGAVVFRVCAGLLSFSPMTGFAATLFVVYGANVNGIVSALRRDDGWWGPSRVIKGAINEFPAWSYLLGDLHPHVMNAMAFPFIVVVLAALARQGACWVCSVVGGVLVSLLVTPLFLYNANTWEVISWGLALGGAGFLAIVWYQPTLSSLRVSVAGAFTVCTQDRRVWGWCAMAGLAALSLYLSSRNILSLGLPLDLISSYVPASPSDMQSIALSRVSEIFDHWGVPLTVIAGSLVVLLGFRPIQLGVIPTLVASLLVRDAVTFLFLVFALFLWRVFLKRSAANGEGFRGCLIELLGFIALSSIIFPEIFYLNDGFGGEHERMNTIFKLYYPAWTMVWLYAFALAAEVYFLLPVGARKRLSIPAHAVLGCLLCLSLSFFVRTVKLRIRDCAEVKVEPAIRGLSRVEQDFPGAAEAIGALSKRAPGVVLEAQGNPYSWTSHVSVLSGNRAFIGWGNHVGVYLKQYDEISRRERLTEHFYREAGCDGRREMMIREGISYVVIGPLERQRYGEQVGDPMGCLSRIIESGRYSIFGLEG